MTKAPRKKKAPKTQVRVARNPAKASCFVYVLGCFATGRYWTYVGWTNDVERRLTRHNAGKGARSTRGRAWVLLHTEGFRSVRQAMSREWHLKRDRKFRKQLADAYRSTLTDAVPI